MLNSPVAASRGHHLPPPPPLEALPPLAPLRRKKRSKSAIFGIFLNISPSETYFDPSMPPKKFWCRHCKSHTTHWIGKTLYVLQVDANNILKKNMLEYIEYTTFGVTMRVKHYQYDIWCIFLYTERQWCVFYINVCLWSSIC